MAELDNVLTALDKIGEKLEHVSTDNTASITAVKSEIKALGDKQLDMARELAALQQTTVAAQPTENKDTSIGGLFTASNAYNALKGDIRNATRAREIISNKSATTSTVGSDYTATRNTLATPYTVAGIVGDPNYPLLIEGLIPHVPVTTGSVQYLKQRGFENNAAVVAEGAAKPESTFEFELQTGNIETVAHWTKITEQLAADAPAVQAFINTKMAYGLQLKIDRQLVNGTGASGQLSGLLNTGNYTDYSSAITIPTGSTLIDFALLIKTKLEELAYAPRYLVLNPSDWAALALLKDAQKRYILGGPAGVTAKTLWGVPVVTTSAIPQGKYLMSDFGLGATIYDRQDMAIELARSGDDFTKNLLTLRVERRLGLVVEDARAIAGGDFVVAS